MSLPTVQTPFDAAAYVGPEQYNRCLAAVRFYRQRGYEWADVPWAVSGNALLITKPPLLPLNECPHFKRLYIVASAEQGFLHQQLEYRATFPGIGLKGRYVALTPCFRNELDFDALHRPYFLKTELIDWDRTTDRDLHDMVALAEEFFSAYLTVDVVETDLEDPLAASKTFDIVSRRGRIELGSYGVRHHQDVGEWLYGTGCAEPRLSYAITKERELGGICA